MHIVIIINIIPYHIEKSYCVLFQQHNNIHNVLKTLHAGRYSVYRY